MSAELEEESQLEIGHVLFMDIVGFSKLLVDEQSTASNRLNEIVRNSEQFRAAEKAGKLMRLPTGDGMVLVFFSSPEAPARCAMEVGQALKECSFGVRMGVHSGPVNKVSDVNDRSNVAGTGINIAQRVMDCGDAGHILLSKRVSEDLEQHSRWRPRLHHLGEFEVKHGTKLDVVSLYTDEIGNPALPEKLKGKQIAAHSRSLKPLFAAAAGVAMIALVSVGIWFAWHRGGQTSTSASAAASVPEKSVAILPFRPVSSQNRDEVLENGMADTLIAKLGTVAEIIIPSLSSAQKYTEQEHDPLAVARLLHVRSVLEGTLQRVADRIRVSARLINVADGSSMWSGTFDEKFTDVFSVQDTIAQKVAAALALRLSGEEQKRLTKRYTDNTEAYQLYLKGRFYWSKYTEEGFRKSIEYFKEAVEKDPNYALAYCGIADSYSLLGEWGVIAPKETFEQARAYLEKALQFDDALSEAHLSLGIVKLFYDWDFAGAEKELRRAKELDSKNAQVYHFYGHYLELVSRFDEAISETKRGVDLDPTNLVLNTEFGNAYYYSHRFDDAIALQRKVLALDPTFIFASLSLAQAYEETGKNQEALAELNRARPISGDWSQIVAELGYVDALLGKRAEAQKIIHELNERASREYIDPCLIAYIYVASGDKDQAFAWLDKAYQLHGGLIGFLQIEPHFDPLRSDPRFNELVHRMGLDRK
jgi:TolB-like protein